MERRYVDDYKHLHATVYGFGGRHMRSILPHIMALKPASIIDYGAGRSRMVDRIAEKVGIGRVARFDPAVEGIDTVPAGRFDLLISCDVLEHIPEEEMDAVLAEMAGLADHHILVIDLLPASATLLDGRNAHVSLHPPEWWFDRVRRFIPGVAPFPVLDPGRCGLKTWTRALPAWRHWLVQTLESRAWKKQHAQERARRKAMKAGAARAD